MMFAGLFVALGRRARGGIQIPAHASSLLCMPSGHMSRSCDGFSICPLRDALVQQARYLRRYTLLSALCFIRGARYEMLFRGLRQTHSKCVPAKN